MAIRFSGSTLTEQLPAATVDSVLKQFSGGRVFFEEMTGNNGDDLIRLGALQTLHDFGLQRVDSPLGADLIAITGGGGMVDFTNRGLQTARHYAEGFPNTPLVILPQSFLLGKTDFARFFDHRKAPAYVFARELVSFDILTKLSFRSDVTLACDHDLALRLKTSPFIERLRENSSSTHLLIVERGDRESVTDYRQKPVGNKFLNACAPKAFKLRLKRAIWKRKIRQMPQTTFQKSAFSLLEASPSETTICGDISSRSIVSFEDFCSLIRDARAVCTNRLHVGVLAAMLDKPTLLVEGSYHKTRGIYEYSLRYFPHVAFRSQI